jgi:ankyrin repeat protein
MPNASEHFETVRSLVYGRIVAFAVTFVLSIVMVNLLPSVKARRQLLFAEAAVDGSVSRMKLLRFAGANINARGSCCMPLFLAAGEGRIAVVRYLLNEGADVNAREKFGSTALIEATFYGHANVVKELVFRGADINAIGDDGTALDVAIARKHLPIADLLRHQGAKRACELRSCN